MNLEALCLLGQFGVKIEETKKTLTSLPKQLAVAELAPQGLPFYSGTVTYRVPVTAKVGDRQRVFLVTPRFEAACVKASADKIIPWPPYATDVTEEFKRAAILRCRQS